MNQYIYDGTFEGFLSVVFQIFETKFEPEQINCRQRQQNILFANFIHVASTVSHAERVWKGLVKKTSKKNADMIYRVFLSEQEDIEILLYNYIKLTFESRRSIEADFGNPVVSEMHKWHKKVMREADRVLMFVRFQKTADEIYYAPFNPKYNVLPISINHFKDRFSDQKWMIYDIKREYGYFYDLNKIQEVRFTSSDIAADGKIDKSILDTEELAFQDLWKNYYKSTTIEERKNLRLQMQFMPKRFWQYLPEKED